MNYTQIYNSLITKRQNEILSKEIYGENHHIIPKCLGGSNKKENLVRLTAREHYIAHLLLAKIHNTFGLYSAVIYIQSGRFENRKFKFNSRLYQKLREEMGKKSSERMKGKFLGKKLSEEHKQKISDANIGCKNSMFGKTHSKEARQKIAEARKGKNNHPNWKPNKEQCKKISEKAKNRLSDKTNHPMYRKQHSEETKRKISEAKKGKIPWNKGKKKKQTKNI